MNAEQSAFTIDPRARRYGKNWRVGCIGHDDRHPSLDICDGRDGKVLFFCRSHQCHERPEFPELLRARGLLGEARSDRGRSPRFSWLEYVSRNRFEPREHQPLGREYLIARLRGELDAAGAEARDLYRTAREPLRRADLERELRLSVELGGIDTAFFAGSVVECMIQKFCGGDGGGDVDGDSVAN